MFKVVSTYYPSGSTFSPLGYFFCTLFFDLPRNLRSEPLTW
nr:MAG TPA: hypothetical protein [Caudoviricetes sp.]